MLRLPAAALFALVSLAAAPAGAAAPCDCDRDCAAGADPVAGLAFDDKAHRDWYGGRFWAGLVVGLLVGLLTVAAAAVWTPAAEQLHDLAPWNAESAR